MAERIYRVVCSSGAKSKTTPDRAFVHSCRDQAQDECRYNPHRVEFTDDGETWATDAPWFPESEAI